MPSTLDHEHAIQRNIIRFARAMDDRDWSALDAITLPDMTADMGTGPLNGRAEVVALMRSFLDECGPTQHLIGNVLVDVDGDTAVSRAYVSDMHLGTGDLAEESFRTLGDYHDRWVRIDGSWFMSHRTKVGRGRIGNIAVLGRGPSA